MTKDQEATVKRVRATHHPYFAQLEAVMRRKLPDLDELGIAFAFFQLLEMVGAEEEMALCDTNPGLDRMQ